MPAIKGTYALILALDTETAIKAGRLAPFSFQEGYYLYAGSALGGLHSRIKRHIRDNKKPHWHIDYLRQEARIIEVWYLDSSVRLECAWYQYAVRLPHAQAVLAGFGSSDCGCYSHLVYFPSAPSFRDFRRQMGDEQGQNLKKMSIS